jgi:hypothetical protein
MILQARLNDVSDAVPTPEEFSLLPPEQQEEIRSSQMRIWNEVTGGLNKKQRAYGRGSMARSFSTSSSSASFSSAPPPGFVSMDDLNQVRAENVQLKQDFNVVREENTHLKHGYDHLMKKYFWLEMCEDRV